MSSINPPKKKATAAEAAALMKAADKPFGQAISKEGEIVRRGIAVPSDVFERAEMLAAKNKMRRVEPKSFTALARVAIEEYLARHEKE
ncbi:hypothetical protein U9S86_004577 [Salmonella enterica]|nr:hypothetical protein [Salmonella enterica]EHA9546192.1 hypothetical protein [Salmonella enterica subsp. enterica serovar Braenderup]EBH4941573.1 hypothetical protein [Salmonella enterica]ECK3278497.1 hypothetical protein [Salmonella enterica]ECK6358165.1 hypothetical protein [Salmonella enterica]